MSADRYVRQIVLPEVGAEGQARLRAARILVIGAGGLGGPVLQYLVGAGVGEITLIDGDIVSVSNLHRQTLYRMDDIGRSKAEAAAASLARLKLETRITPMTVAFDPANAARLVQGATIVLDCADSFAASYIASDTCFAQDIPLISASALELSGYVGGFCGGAPSLRAVFPDLPETLATCATSGVLGPVVGTIGALQAQMAMSVLLGLHPSPLGQVVTFDAQKFRFGGFRFDQANEPENRLAFIARDDIKEEDFIIELRGEQEAPHPIHPHAIRSTAEGFNSTPENCQRAVFACRSGLRAWRAASKLRARWQGDIALIALGDDINKRKNE